jgi:hypothetical protein
LENRTFSGEFVSHVIVRKALLCRHESFVPTDTPVYAWKKFKAILHLYRQCLPQVSIFDMVNMAQVHFDVDRKTAFDEFENKL